MGSLARSNCQYESTAQIATISAANLAVAHLNQTVSIRASVFGFATIVLDLVADS